MPSEPTPPTSSLLPRLALPLVAALFISGCATSQPVIYSARQEAVVVSDRTRQDIAACARQADARVGRNGLNARQAARQSGSTAAVGAVATAVGSVVQGSRNVWERTRVAAAGGAAGMATKLIFEWNEGDEVFQSYVERCLQARGHDVLGWR